MLEFLRFELHYRFKQPAVYLFAFLFGIITFAAMTTDAVQIGGGAGLTAINSPFVITQMLMIMSIMAVLLVVAFTAGSVVRDYDLSTYTLFFSKPIKKMSYLLGRFTGGTAAALFVMLGATFGLALGSFMPWLDPERLVAFSPLAYASPIFIFILPNLVIMGAMFFSLASLTRRLLWAYVGVVAFFVLWGVSQAFIADLDYDSVAALSDPFGFNAFELATRYWSPADKNIQVVGFTGWIALNRLVWLGIAAGIMTLTFRRFRLLAPEIKAAKRRTEPDAVSSAPRAQSILKAERAFGMSSQLLQLRHYVGVELRSVFKSAPFIVIALLMAANVMGNAFGTADQIFGTSVYPVTQLMVGLLDGNLTLYMLVVITFYASEMIWRDRKLGLAGVNDALPVPDWVPLTAKVVALWATLAALIAIGIATTIGVQLSKGYTNLEPGLYFTAMFGHSLSRWAIVAVLALFAQVVTNHRIAGYGIMVLYFVAIIALPAMDYQHHLYRFASAPRLELSDMNGYGHFAEAIAWYRLYWGLAAFIMLVAAYHLWIRGTEDRFRMRLKRAFAKRTGLSTALFSAALLGFVMSGGFIYYNTNVVNTYLSEDDELDRQKSYELLHKKHEDQPQPQLIAVDLNVDLFPETRKVDVSGTLTLENKTSAPVDEIHLSVSPDLEIRKMSIPNGTLTSKEGGYYIFRLSAPLAPAQTVPLLYSAHFSEAGFKDRASSISLVHNGTFMHNYELVPAVGYQRALEIAEPNERRKRDLPKRPRMAKIDDDEARRWTYVTQNANWIDFKATVSTHASQTALAPGYLTKTWEKDGRRYFRYEMDAPILNLYGFLSAQYTVVKDKWKDVDIAVYHHAPHNYNVDRMIESVKKSLDYFTENFSPYQHRQVRIVEFPRYRGFAQSLPNIIPYSESIGFIADLRDDEDIDYVFYVTAHEVAHQWWAHQVIGGNVQGSTLLSEGMAEYSALMVMEKEYGKEKMRKFLKHNLDRYLRGRGQEAHEEVPLLLVENQPYIHYAKGSMAMYTLREYIGEEPINQALARFVKKTAFQRAPFTTSHELYAELEAITPDKYKYLLEDLFEHITLYDNRAVSAKATPAEKDTYTVELVVASRKFRANGKGVETEVPLNDWIPIGILDDEGNLLYLEKHYLNSPETTLTFTVSGKPSQAGIDPNILLIDRSPDDNTVRL